MSRPVKIIRGLKQGSILSPVLFSMLTKSVNKGINGGLIIDLCDISLLCYADDLLMTINNLSTLQCNLNQLTRGYDCLGLSVNAKKTEFLIFGSRPCMQNSTRINPTT